MSLLRLMSVLAFAVLGCGPMDARTTPSSHRDAVAGLETTLSRSLRYERFDEAPRPTHLSAGGDRLWLLAEHSRSQRTLEHSGRRIGPADVRRCVAVGPGTVCVGAQQRGGLVVFDHPGFSPELAGYRGYRDIAALDAGVAVLDTVAAALVQLDAAGREVARLPVSAASHTVLPLGPDHLLVLSGVAPQLSVLRIGEAGLEAVGDIERQAPVRAAAYEATRQRLWLVGPEDRRVRRRGGPLRGLDAELVVLDAEALRRGVRRIVHRADLSESGCVDPSDIVATSGGTYIAATGSDAVCVVDEAFAVRSVAVGAAPSSLVAFDGGVAVICPPDGAVYFLRGSDVSRRAEVAPPTARGDLVAQGERLFFGAYLWRQRPGHEVTCNSCHWRGGTDHRVQPGFAERRWEVTRPLGGIGAIVPIFTTGGAPDLTQAIEGLLRSLDHRLWEPGPERRYWEYSVALRHPEGELLLSPGEVRTSLLAYLMNLPATPGPLRGYDEPRHVLARERGSQVFADECARCHEPLADQRSRRLVVPEDWAATLTERPLTFGSPALAEVGAGPSFTANGNRVTPLLNLGRGGPFFAGGSAPRLEDVLARYRVGAATVHGASAGTTLSPREQAALRVFLLSL